MRTAPTVAAGDCIGEEVVVEVGERGCRWVTGAGEAASLVRSIGVVMCARCAREAAEGRPGASALTDYRAASLDCSARALNSKYL